GGTFALTPRDRTAASRRYLPNTNVLETTFSTKTGVARVLDCFSMREGGRTHPHRQLLRIVEGVEGEVSFDLLIQPRFDYGSLRPWLRHHPERGVYSAVGGNDAFALQADIPLSISHEDSSLVAQLNIRRGPGRRFSTISQPPPALGLERLSHSALDRRLQTTIQWWQRWVRRGHYDQTYRAPVVRSALVLKLLTCAPTGAIIAAPTTSLPECPGGERNWDYRFCWVRDSTMTLAALLLSGHDESASRYRKFIENATAGRAAELQIVYG